MVGQEPQRHSMLSRQGALSPEDRERVKPDYQAAELELSFKLRRAGSSSARRTI